MFLSGSRGMASSNIDYFELPGLITLQEFGDDFDAYLEAVYEIFRDSFVTRKPVFQGRTLGLKAHPVIEGKEYTFWHMISKGESEAERDPDLKRMERIRWSPEMINGAEHPYLKVWRNIRAGGQESILIWHDAENFLVVLRDRGNYLLPWTAYPVSYRNMKAKLMKEYKAYTASKKAETAQSD
jgi:hypothetical protein